MNQIILVVSFLALEVLIAYLFGAEMRSSNPDGVWLSTPPADGSGSPSDAFSVGSSIGLILISLIYLAASVSIYTWGKLKSAKLSHIFSPLVASSIIGFSVVALFGELAL